MDHDYLSEIDAMLAEELPDSEDAAGTPVDEDKREDMIQLLKHAAEELGKSPTREEFDSLGFDVSADQIRYVFGTWNEAKSAAGLETWQRGTVRSINETYFQSIDTPEKAYWFGALLATSSVHRQPTGQNFSLQLGRVEDKEYFVTAFADAVDSDYQLTRYDSNKSDKKQVQLIISNPRFMECLLEAGYPKPDEIPGDFPHIDESLRASFVRGFLESSGYFTTNGWGIVVENIQRGETLQTWFKQYGAKRPTMSQVSSGDIVVRVSNPFDIKAIFESLWPEVLETEPSWKPYPRKILQHLEDEDPYPENLPYLDS